jgi:DNA-binding NarL/FixJ family response regulator
VLISIRSISDEQSVESSLVEITDITNLKQTERNMVRLQRELEEAQSEGHKKEAALSAVLSHLETERSNYRKQVHHRVYRAILPYLERLKSSEPLSETQAKEMEDAMLVSLDHDVDDYEVYKNNLSPKEQLICKDIATGMTSKEISDKMYLSVETVRKHRKSIRRKLKLTRKGANLTTYLRQHIDSED